MGDRMRAERVLAATAAFAVVAALSVCLPAGPAAAIIGSQVDGNRHPYVGTLDASAMGRPDGPTGVLISPTVLLTAGHVTRDWARRGLQARVTFDPDRATATTWYSGTVHTNPSFDPQRADDPGDLGVVVFDTPVIGITPATIPSAGLLDGLGPKGPSFEVVGYGVSEFSEDPRAAGPRIATGPRPALARSPSRRSTR